MSGVPSDSSSAAAPIPPALTLPLAAAAVTAVMSWLMLRSRLTGWTLAATMLVVFFGVQTFLAQVESWIFQAWPGYASHLPAEMIPRIVLAGLVHACLWIPLAVLALGRWRPSPGGAPLYDPPPPFWGWRLAGASFAYAVLYFVFGHFVAWRSAAVRAYYQGTDAGSFFRQMGVTVRTTPWLPLAQVARGAMWTLLGLAVVRSMHGSRRERALAVGALFAVVMNASLLLPNPYMPYEVRMVHLVETASSNFLFGLLVGWLFAR
jgi:hypothetical protein